MLRMPLRKCTGAAVRRRLPDARLARKPYIRFTVDTHIPKSAPSTALRAVHRARGSRFQKRNAFSAPYGALVAKGIRSAFVRGVPVQSKANLSVEEARREWCVFFSMDHLLFGI